MSDLVGGSADFDPIPYLGYSFVHADAHNVPHKTMVIDVDEETGRVLLEYVHGQMEWVEPNILQEALLSARSERRWYKPLDLQHGPGPQDRE